jgi:hypothetical protein
VTKALDGLAKNGMIELGYRRIKIVDVEKLREATSSGR